MDVSLWTGTGSNQTISGLAFQPDFIWAKNRNAGNNHVLFDSVRGFNSNNPLYSDQTWTQGQFPYGDIKSVNSTGYVVGAGTSGDNYINYNTYTYAGWTWKAGGTAVSNTAGTITSQVSANTTSGFSVVTYTGTGSNATVGHGLGVAPKMIIVKNRPSSVDNWQVYHASLTSAAYRMTLNTSNAQDSVPTMWNSTAPTSAVFSVGTQSGSNGSGNAMVAYCWSEVAGFSKFGSYTGNGSADGPFVYLGFRPRWIMIKKTDSTSDWWIWDTARNTYNQMNTVLYPNLSSAEVADPVFNFDALSNGFKNRSSNATVNGSGATYIYAAFAENPFKYALAR
jgi:hypothetical protein